VNFTREPIIETVITPKEGSKLCVRSSKAAGQEEYLVEAVEVVSFGKASFFRSLEKPKSFLVPVADYELVEVKEARMVLKGVGFEKPIKIGGGKEVQKEPVEEKVSEPQVETPQQENVQQQSFEEKKRDRKRYRRKGRHMRPEESFTSQPQEASLEHSEEKKEEVPPAVIRKLIPPPSTLIKEKLAQIKGSIDEELFAPTEVTLSEGESLKVEEKVEEKKESEEEFPTFNQDQLD
jgi:hypothetical protein